MFMSDPSDFVIRRYLPRIYGSLTPLEKLPSLNGMFGGFEGSLGLLNGPEFRKLAKTLAKAAKEQQDYRETIGNLHDDLDQVGLPAPFYVRAESRSVFRYRSSFFRGMKGSMLDMYRRPDKLIQLCEKVMDLRIRGAMPAEPDPNGFPKRVAMPLWRGDKSFMSEASVSANSTGRD